jgi:hypothetical protein
MRKRNLSHLHNLARAEAMRTRTGLRGQPVREITKLPVWAPVSTSARCLAFTEEAHRHEITAHTRLAGIGFPRIASRTCLPCSRQ